MFIENDVDNFNLFIFNWNLGIYFGVICFNQVLIIYNFKKKWFLGLQKQMSMVIIIIWM
jgi:hypothetical protein